MKYDFTGSGSEEIMEPDEMSLRRRQFEGNLLLKQDDRTIIINQQSMPIIESAFCMLHICSVLLQKKDGREDFELSQSNKKITFEKNNGNVKVIPSFSVTTLEIPLDDFRTGIKRFFDNVLREIIKNSHSLKMSVLLFRYLNEAETI